MRSTELKLDQYNTDKIANGYLPYYDAILKPWVGRSIKLLELGIREGGSLLFWRDYFTSGTIVGIDINLPPAFKPADRVHLYQGSQADIGFLSEVARKTAPDGFDIIIDDASHVAELTRVSFWHLFDHHLKPGGLFVIEDWACGYWEDWPDGKAVDRDRLLAHRQAPRNTLLNRLGRRLGFKQPIPSHNYGMVGFLKQLIDEQGNAELTRGRLGGPSCQPSKFNGVAIFPPFICITKAIPSGDPIPSLPD